GIGALTNRTGCTVKVRTVAAWTPGKVVPADNPGKALALGDARHVHLVARLEDVGADFIPRLQRVFPLNAELAQHLLGSHASLFEMAAHGLVQTAVLDFTETHLDSFIAVGFLGLPLNNRAWSGFEQGDFN